MATVSRSDYANVIMEEWEKTVPSLVNMKYWLNNNLETRTVQYDGESKINVPMEIYGTVSAAPTTENIVHPTPTSPVFAKGALYLKKILAKMLFSEETLVLKGKNTIVDSMRRLLDNVLEDFNMMREFQMHQPADGVIAVATGTTSGTYITSVDSARWIRPGMTLDAWASYADATADTLSFTVTDVDYDNNTMTSAANPSHADNTEYLIAGTINSNNWVSSSYPSGHIDDTYFCNGIETLINSSDPDYGDIMGLDRGTYSYASAVVKTGASAGTAEALTLARMRAVLDSIDINWGRDLPNIIYCSIGVFNAYQEVLRNANQPTVAMPAKDGYPAGLEFVYNGNVLRLVSSRLCLPNTMFFINTKHLIKYKGETGWDALTGTQPVASYQQFYRVYRGWENYAVDVFKAHGRLNDISAVA